MTSGTSWNREQRWPCTPIYHFTSRFLLVSPACLAGNVFVFYRHTVGRNIFGSVNWNEFLENIHIYYLIHSARFTLAHFKSHSWSSVFASVTKSVWDGFHLHMCPIVLRLWPQLLNVHLLHLVNPNEPASLSCCYRNTRVNERTRLVTHIRSGPCCGCNLAWWDNFSLQCMFIHPVASWTTVLWVWLLLREEMPVRTYEWKKVHDVLCQLVYVQSGLQTSDNGWATVKVEKNDQLAHILMLAKRLSM